MSDAASTHLYVGVAPFTHGEVALLMNFADQVERQSAFVVAPSHRDIVGDRGHRVLDLHPGHRAGDENAARIRGLLAEMRVSAIVVPDLLSLWYAEPIFGIELDSWFDLGVPVVALDSHGWSDLSSFMDIAGVDFSPAAFEPEDVARYVAKMHATVRVCPFQRPAHGTHEIAMYRKVGVGYDRDAIRLRYGCRPYESLVVLFGRLDPKATTAANRPVLEALMASSVGQRLLPSMMSVGKMMTTCSPSLERLYSVMMEEVFVEVERPMVVVTPAHTTASVTSSEDRQGSVRRITIPLTNEADFDYLVAAADLVVSPNEISNAMMKAVLAGTPTIALRNSLDTIDEIDFDRLTTKAKKLAGELGALFPWRYFPVGLFRYYTPLVDDNEADNLVRRVEFFDPIDFIAAIRERLDGSRVVQEIQNAQQVYASRIDALPTASEVARNIGI